MMPFIKIKPGVSLTHLKPQMAVALPIIHSVLSNFSSYSIPTVITSGYDGVHSHNSLHKFGYALDIRSRELSWDAQKEFIKQLKICLGPEYDVVLESDHIHVEWDAYRAGILMKSKLKEDWKNEYLSD